MKQQSAQHWKASWRGALLLVLWVSLLMPWGSAPTVHAETAAGCPAGRKCVYFPVVNRPALGDIVLSGIEISQAVQDSSNSVPLVDGRSTILRIFARVTGSNVPLSNVKVSVSASVANQQLSSSPSAFSATVPLSYDRANLNSTINVQLPLAWTHGTVDLNIRLDSNNAFGETNENNNALTYRAVFQPVPPLNIKIVPIQYENPNDHRVYPAPTRDTISEWILRTYPVSSVNVSFHSPVVWRENLSTYSGIYNLLDHVTALKNSENQPESTVYYGLIPTSNGTNSWFYGGIAGIGWVGGRASVGLDLSNNASQIAAHEIGHNLGLYHSPCGNVDPNSLESGFPYGDGSIGQYGLNIDRANNTQVVIAPSAKDVMSYCSNKWVSDYVYKKLFSAQVRASDSPAFQSMMASEGQRSLMVRARITPAGAELLPAYVLPGATPLPQGGEYTVEVLGIDGSLLSSVPVAAYTADANLEAQAAGINVRVPLPEQPAAAFRLVKDGVVLAEQPLQSNAAFAPSSQGLSEGQTALVRYSTDGGQTWTTLGVDIHGGELLARAANPAPGEIYEVIPAGTWK